MKTLGLIGGTGWISTVEYYRLINQEVNRRLGGLEAARILLHSFNYGDIDRFNKREDHAGILSMLQDAAWALAGAGADVLVLCANTLHRYADDLQPMVSRPILHIASATAENIRARGMSRVGLMGTRATMEMDFCRRRLADAGIDVLVPDEASRTFIHGTIMGELLKGEFRPESKSRLLSIAAGLGARGAQGIVLGCTEIPLILRQEDSDLPLFDTLAIHARAAAEFAVASAGASETYSQRTLEGENP